MKVSDLELDQEVEINGISYKYKGVQKIRKINFGTVQQIVFEKRLENRYDYKYFDLKVLSRVLKTNDGKIIF